MRSTRARASGTLSVATTRTCGAWSPFCARLKTVARLTAGALAPFAPQSGFAADFFFRAGVAAVFLPLAGFPVIDFKVALIEGKYHDVDSSVLAFEIAARMGMREGMKKAGAKLLEPMMKVEVVTPEEYMGDIIGDLNKRRGQVEGMETKAGARVIKAKVPLAEKFGYVTVLRTLTSGRATSTMEFSHYEEVPENIATQIIEKIRGFKAAV